MGIPESSSLKYFLKHRPISHRRRKSYHERIWAAQEKMYLSLLSKEDIKQQRGTCSLLHPHHDRGSVHVGVYTAPAPSVHHLLRHSPGVSTLLLLLLH